MPEAKRDDMRREALKRMRAWGLYPEVVRIFEEDGKILQSEPPYGACFDISDSTLSRIAGIEERYGLLVYHVIQSVTAFGRMEAYLYVSGYPDEWEADGRDIEGGIAIAYVYNIDDPDLSEFGSIGVKLSPAAGLIRTS